MLYGAFRFLAVMLSVCVILAAGFLHAICLVDEIVVSGRVENAPVKGRFGCSFFIRIIKQVTRPK